MAMANPFLKPLPPGFRFKPTDDELLACFLLPKMNGEEVNYIKEIDIYDYDPGNLPGQSLLPSKDWEWYFFCRPGKKFLKGNQLNRTTNTGYWKATGRDRPVQSGDRTQIGMKKTLVFYTGRAPKGKRTNWVMYEYRATQPELDGTKPDQPPVVVCRLMQKQDELTGVSPPKTLPSGEPEGQIGEETTSEFRYYLEYFNDPPAPTLLGPMYYTVTVCSNGNNGVQFQYETNEPEHTSNFQNSILNDHGENISDDLGTENNLAVDVNTLRNVTSDGDDVLLSEAYDEGEDMV